MKTPLLMRFQTPIPEVGGFAAWQEFAGIRGYDEYPEVRAIGGRGVGVKRKEM